MTVRLINYWPAYFVFFLIWLQSIYLFIYLCSTKWLFEDQVQLIDLFGANQKFNDINDIQKSHELWQT